MALTVIVIAVLAVLPRAKLPSTGQEPVHFALSKACASTESGTLVAGSTRGEVSLRGTSGQTGTSDQTGTSPVSQPLAAGTTMITPRDAQASVVGGVFGSTRATSGATNWFSPCAEARTDQLLLFPGGAATLLMTNPGATDAVASITLTGPQGNIGAPELRDVTVPAGATVSINLDSHVGHVAQAGVRIRTTRGQLSAVVRSGQVTGVDYQGATTLSRDSTVAAIPAGADRVTLLLSNPDTVRTSARLSVLGQSGPFDPGNGSIVVEAESTIAVDLPASVSVEAAAVRVAARSNIAVSAVITKGADIALLAAQPTSSTVPTTAMAALPAAGQLIVSNVDEEPVNVTVDWGADQAATTRMIPAGSSIQLTTPQNVELVRISGDGRLVAGAEIAQAGLSLVTAQSVPGEGTSAVARPAVELGR